MTHRRARKWSCLWSKDELVRPESVQPIDEMVGPRILLSIGKQTPRITFIMISESLTPWAPFNSTPWVIDPSSLSLVFYGPLQAAFGPDSNWDKLYYFAFRFVDSMGLQLLGSRTIDSMDPPVCQWTPSNCIRLSLGQQTVWDLYFWP